MVGSPATSWAPLTKLRDVGSRDSGFREIVWNEGLANDEGLSFRLCYFDVEKTLSSSSFEMISRMHSSSTYVGQR